MGEYIVETNMNPGYDRMGNKIKEIVRCRDCDCFAIDEYGGYCTLFDFGDVNNMESKFCAWGIPKDDTHA